MSIYPVNHIGLDQVEEVRKALLDSVAQVSLLCKLSALAVRLQTSSEDGRIPGLRENSSESASW